MTTVEGFPPRPGNGLLLLCLDVALSPPSSSRPRHKLVPPQESPPQQPTLSLTQPWVPTLLCSASSPCFSFRLFSTAAVCASEVIFWVSDTLTSPPDCHFHKGRGLLNDVPVSSGPDLAPGGHCKYSLNNKSTTLKKFTFKTRTVKYWLLKLKPG